MSTNQRKIQTLKKFLNFFIKNYLLGKKLYQHFTKAFQRAFSTEHTLSNHTLFSLSYSHMIIVRSILAESKDGTKRKKRNDQNDIFYKRWQFLLFCPIPRV